MTTDPAVDMWRNGVTDRALRHIKDERRRQIVKWGHQSRGNGTGPHFQTFADMFRNACDNAEAEGGATWRHILLEEVYEALSERDPDKLRAELVQVSAVATAWIEDIDLTEGNSP